MHFILLPNIHELPPSCRSHIFSTNPKDSSTTRGGLIIKTIKHAVTNYQLRIEIIFYSSRNVQRHKWEWKWKETGGGRGGSFGYLINQCSNFTGTKISQVLKKFSVTFFSPDICSKIVSSRTYFSLFFPKFHAITTQTVRHMKTASATLKINVSFVVSFTRFHILSKAENERTSTEFNTTINECTFCLAKIVNAALIFVDIQSRNKCLISCGHLGNSHFTPAICRLPVIQLKCSLL